MMQVHSCVQVTGDQCVLDFVKTSDEPIEAFPLLVFGKEINATSINNAFLRSGASTGVPIHVKSAHGLDCCFLLFQMLKRFRRVCVNQNAGCATVGNRKRKMIVWRTNVNIIPIVAEWLLSCDVISAYRVAVVQKCRPKRQLLL